MVSWLSSSNRPTQRSHPKSNVEPRLTFPVLANQYCKSRCTARHRRKAHGIHVADVGRSCFGKKPIRPQRIRARAVFEGWRGIKWIPGRHVAAGNGTQGCPK
jgi:hypothetical protein